MLKRFTWKQGTRRCVRTLWSSAFLSNLQQETLLSRLDPEESEREQEVHRLDVNTSVRSYRHDDTDHDTLSHVLKWTSSPVMNSVRVEQPRGAEKQRL